MSSLAPCLHEEADTKFLVVQLKGLNKKISNCAVDTDVVVLVIPVVQQLCVARLRGW